VLLARVVGTVWATQKVSVHADQKIMVCVPVGLEGEPKGGTFLAIDRAQAGVGDVVLVSQEGKCCNLLIGREWAACNSAILGVVDLIEAEGRSARFA
jgi:ethanolamine utilization protein EutN